MVTIYTDGAIKSGIPAWGFVALNEKGIIIRQEWGKITGSESFMKMRNVAGEIMAVCCALIWAENHGHKTVHIVHDYTGCAEWPLENWQAKNEHTQRYRDFVKKKITEGLTITWEHIRGHTGNVWNEHADLLAKKGAAGESKREFTISARKET